MASNVANAAHNAAHGPTTVEELAEAERQFAKDLNEEIERICRVIWESGGDHEVNVGE